MHNIWINIVSVQRTRTNQRTNGNSAQINGRICKKKPHMWVDALDSMNVNSVFLICIEALYM